MTANWTLRLVCTGRGAHPSYELGMVTREPHAEPDPLGVTCGDAGGMLYLFFELPTPHGKAGPQRIEKRFRTTKAGVDRMTKLGAGVEMFRHTPIGPGTFTISCPRCIKQSEIRSERLALIADAWHAGDTPNAPFDVSSLD